MKFKLNHAKNEIGHYNNGNYTVTMYDDGTKVRETHDRHATEFLPNKPESIDLKITNFCEGANCAWCHEDSTPQGLHGDIMRLPFVDTLQPFSELAIGGGNPLAHPGLEVFLRKCKDLNIIANITVNYIHYMSAGYHDMLVSLAKRGLIHGIGISIPQDRDVDFAALRALPNIVLHLIVGIHDIMQFSNTDFKILLLGYKDLRRGKSYLNRDKEKVRFKTYCCMEDIRKNADSFSLISFDNLALKQLHVKEWLSPDLWDKLYMGDDGQFTMYVDAVRKECAKSSTATTRYKLTDNIADMFATVRGV